MNTLGPPERYLWAERRRGARPAVGPGWWNPLSRRERSAIYGAILEALEIEAASGTRPKATRIAAHANVPFDRLQVYLDEMLAARMLADASLGVTPRGREYLAEYRRWARVLASYGLNGPAE